MKVLVHLPFDEAVEPSQQICFIAGYEAGGGVWSGDIYQSSQQNQLYDYDSIIAAFEFALANGITLIVSPSFDWRWNSAIDYYYKLGIQCVFPRGTNWYHSNPSNTPFLGYKRAIIVGAGEIENMTGYPIEFYDIDVVIGGPQSEMPIRYITQEGNKTYIQGWDIPDAIGSLAWINWAVHIKGVTGFQHNPNGVFKVTDFCREQPDPCAYWNRYKFIHDLGTGSYTGPGGYSVGHTSSNATPYIGGKIAYIKDTLNCSWWEARYRMRKTASNSENFNEIQGYGRANVSAALNYIGTIPPDTNSFLGQIGTNFNVERAGEGIIQFQIPYVENATLYKIYRNGIEYLTVNPLELEGATIFYVLHNIQRAYRSDKLSFTYKAFDLYNETEFSNETSINYYKFKTLRFGYTTLPEITNLNYICQSSNMLTVNSKQIEFEENFNSFKTITKFIDKYFKEHYSQLFTTVNFEGNIYMINVGNITDHSVSGDTINLVFGEKSVSIKYEIEREAEEDYQSLIRVYQAYNHLLNPPGSVTHITGPEKRDGVISRAIASAGHNETIIVKAGLYNNELFNLRTGVYLYLEKNAIIKHAGVLGAVFGEGIISEQGHGTVGRIYGFGTIDVSGACIYSSKQDSTDIYIQCEKFIGSDTDMMFYNTKSTQSGYSRLQIKAKTLEYQPSNQYTVYDYDLWSPGFVEFDLVNVECGDTAFMYGASDTHTSIVFRNFYCNCNTAYRGNIEIVGDLQSNYLRLIKIKLLNRHFYGNNISLLNTNGDIQHSIKLASCVLSSYGTSIDSNYAINVKLQNKCYSKSDKAALVTVTGNGTLVIDENLIIKPT